MTTTFIIAGVAVAALIIFLLFGYVKAPPDVAYIISGMHKNPRVLIGKAGVKIPFFERLDKLYLGATQIDVKTRSSIPTADYINVNVDSTVAVRVDKNALSVAAENFLNVGRDVIGEKVNDLLEGNIREIIGQMKLTEMVSDRKTFSKKVQENAVPDLAEYGLELVSFNVQNFMDDNSVIENLGVDNVAQIQKEAAIAKSNAEREIAIAKAQNAKIANDAQTAAQEEIAIRQNVLVMKKADLKKQEDTAMAQADAAREIEAQNQRKSKDVASAEADIARQEKEIELKERQVAVTEKALEAEIKKKADADKYAAEQRADAGLYSAQKASEAELFERAKKAEANKIEAEREAEAKMAIAEAVKAQGIAEAEATRVRGEAEAAAIKAKLEAEADGLRKKADAMKEYGEAAQMNMTLETLKVYFEQLPAIAEAIGNGYNNVGEIYMYGGETSQLAGDIMKNVSQVTEGLNKSFGINIQNLLGGYLGGKVAANEVE